LCSRGARYPHPSSQSRSSESEHSWATDGKLKRAAPSLSHPRRFSSKFAHSEATICMLRLMLLLAEPMKDTRLSRRDSTLTTRTPGSAAAA